MTEKRWLLVLVAASIAACVLIVTDRAYGVPAAVVTVTAFVAILWGLRNA